MHHHQSFGTVHHISRPNLRKITTSYAPNRKEVESKPGNKLVSDYIEHVLRSEFEEDARSSSPRSDTNTTSSTDSEVEELKQTIETLQQANQGLQKEMNRVIRRLSSLIKDAKQTSKSKSLTDDTPHPITLPPDATKRINCVLQHPGALACTQATFHVDPLDQKYIINIQATATANDDASSHLTIDDLGAIAAQALLASASQTLREQTRAIQNKTPSNEYARQTHAEICHLLLTGEIIEAERNTVVSPFGHESFIVTLKDIHNDRRMKAIFKPRVKGDADGWHRAPCEWLAYKLNLLLGMDRVPPCAYRTDIQFTVDDGQRVSYKEGAMMYFVENAMPLMETEKESWNCSLEVLLSDTRILDVLLANSDRHAGHFLLGKHWCDNSSSGNCDSSNGSNGSSSSNKSSNKSKNNNSTTTNTTNTNNTKHVILIDHAASLRSNADVTMQHENAFMTGPVRCVSATTYLRLRFLDYSTIASEFSGVMSEEEMRGMVKRRDATLQYIDRLVAERGYSNVVRE